jgi:hypothetical protein
MHAKKFNKGFDNTFRRNRLARRKGNVKVQLFIIKDEILLRYFADIANELGDGDIIEVYIVQRRSFLLDNYTIHFICGIEIDTEAKSRHAKKNRKNAFFHFYRSKFYGSSCIIKPALFF